MHDKSNFNIDKNDEITLYNHLLLLLLLLRTTLKILLVNNFYYNRGGDTTHLFLLKKLFEKEGHDVVIFSMHHPDNFKSKYSSYFTSYIDYSKIVNNKSIKNIIRVISKSIYSLEAKKKIEKLLKEERPDIAHLQNIYHHITPSIIHALKKFKIPILWTMHDFTAICPNSSFMVNGKLCENCKKRKFYWTVIKKCKRNSLSASIVAAFETTIFRIFRIYRHINVIITPSIFLKNKLIEYGFKRNNIHCINNFLDIDFDESDEHESNYYLFFGRLVEGKGIETLLKAVKNIELKKLLIIGDGHLRKKLEDFVKTNSLNSRIVFAGYKPRDEMIKIIKKSLFVIVPSEWYENYPYSILESFACGKPVIGSNLGGIPEQVIDGKTGLLFKSGNAENLKEKIIYLINNPEKIIEMGNNARNFVNELNPESHYRKTIQIYEKLLNN
ncbi:glycosyltransferase family 4 protein [Spirochaetota bacterium]